METHLTAAIYCSACGSILDSDAHFCPSCGQSVETGQQPEPEKHSPALKASRRPLATILVSAAILIMVMVVAGFTWNYLRLRSVDTFDINTEGFPVQFDRETHRRFPTPAQLTFKHLMDVAARNHGNNLKVGVPFTEPDVVEVTLTVAGESTTMSFIEFENNGRIARVMVGPVDSEPDGIYVLRKTLLSRWKIIGIEPVIFPGEDDF